MKSPLQSKCGLRFLVGLALLTSLSSLCAADEAKTATDPFAGAFFPPEVVLVTRDRIGMTPAQQETFRKDVEKAQPQSSALRAKLERETATLSALAKTQPADEAALLAQLDKVLDLERELKHLHLGLLVAIKNLLTPAQQTQLREIVGQGDAQFTKEMVKRLSERVEQVKAGVQKWVASGRDPSGIAKAMDEKVKPLIDAGKIIEAEAELDRLLEQLKVDTK
ncbi:MAG: hypothetical protein P4L99_29945 [Chthoniobacter sp.]|nr:hypothetical protein [Chthoniobacter sp.]